MLLSEFPRLSPYSELQRAEANLCKQAAMSRCHWSVNNDGGQGRGSCKGHGVVMDMVINDGGLKELAEKTGCVCGEGAGGERWERRVSGDWRNEWMTEEKRFTDIPRSPNYGSLYRGK